LPPYFGGCFWLLDRYTLFAAMAGTPDFSAMSRSCSSIMARAEASPSSPPGLRSALCD
jgi:hypothetical protein